jgi:hypothetical protein
MFDPLSLAIIAASAFLKYQANEDAAERREAFRRQMEAYQRTRSAESTAATERLLEKQTPAARSEEMTTIAADRERSLRDTVGAAQAFDAPQIAGKLPGDYTSTQEANANRIAERTRRAIAQLAAMGAPEEQQLQHGLRFGRAASAVDAANDASKNVTSGYVMDIEGVRPDPFLGMVSGLGMAVGQGMLGASGAGRADAAGTGIIPGTAGEGLRIGAGTPGLKVPSSALQTRLKNAFSLWGL